jgi:hypothetical protein
MNFMSPLPFLLAVSAEHSPAGAAASRPLLGLLMVAAIVGILLGANKISRVLRGRAALSRAVDDGASTAPSPNLPAAPAADTPLPPELVAVIAAAVDVMFHGRGRLQTIREHPEHSAPDPGLLVWSMEGRRQIFSSHQPR